MKRLMLVLAGTLAATGVALAQPPTPQGPHPGRPGDRLAEDLKLTDAQKATWKQMREAQRKELQPLFEQGRALHDGLEAALDEPTPDAQKVGEAAIAVHQHRKEIEAAMAGFDQKLAAVLDEDQRARFQEIRASRGPGAGPRFRAPFPLPPPPR